jgi:transglutaminase-like putative cysteine protease
MSSLLIRVLTRQNIILLLTLTALACLPFAIRELVPDAGLSLLMPVTLTGALLAWITAPLNFKSSWVRFIFFVAGPLMIFGVIGQLGRPLFTAVLEDLKILPQFILWIRSQTPVDFSASSAAQQEFITRASALAQRIFTWIAGRLRGEAVQDPAARAFVWSLVLWLTSAWAGWQMRFNLLGESRIDKRTLIALLPATALLTWVLDITSQKSVAFWLHLATLLFLLGLAHYESLARIWRQKRMDFSESIWEDTLLATSALTLTAIVASFLAYSISIEDIRDRIREWDEQRTRTSNSGQTTTEDGPPNGSRTGQGLGSIHSVTAGPQLSTDIIMIVTTGDRPAVPQAVDLDVPYYYWRTMTYQTYFGTGWTNPVNPIFEQSASQPLMQANPPGYRVVHQEVIFPSGPTRHLYWTGTLMGADVPLELTWRAAPEADIATDDLDTLLQADLISALTPAESYTADSLLSIYSENDLRAARAIYPDWVTERYLRLPETVPERVLALARDITATSLTPYDRAVAIETYLRQIPYNLDVPGPPTGRDVADYFIFDLKQGYCDYHATAMTVLARAAGLPARFVIGYANGTYNSLDAHYVVTQADSHAWTEIYFPGIGWVEFEPTPSEPAPIRASRADIPTFTPAPAEPINWSGIPLLLTRALDVLWPPVAVLALLYVLWIGTEFLRLDRYEPVELIGRLYGRLRRLARPVSGWPPHSQTAYEYAAALSAGLSTLRDQSRLNGWLLTPAQAHVKTLTELYIQSLFSPHPAGRAEGKRAARAWIGLRWRLNLLNLILFFNKPAKAARLSASTD